MKFPEDGQKYGPKHVYLAIFIFVAPTWSICEMLRFTSVS
jgi:hypothetical protein